MPDFNTEFIQTLFNPATTELFRSELEAAINALLKTELAAFLGYEKHDSDGWNKATAATAITSARWRHAMESCIWKSREIGTAISIRPRCHAIFSTPMLWRLRSSSFISAASPPVRLQISASRCMDDITRQPLSRISRQPSPSKSKPSIPDRLLRDMPSSSVMPPT